MPRKNRRRSIPRARKHKGKKFDPKRAYLTPAVLHPWKRPRTA